LGGAVGGGVKNLSDGIKYPDGGAMSRAINKV
jgi:hypothetical protein